MARFVPYQSNKAFLSPDRDTINGIEDAIRWAEYEVPSQLRKEMRNLCYYMALINQGEARAMSFGPHDPQARGFTSHYRGRIFMAGTSGPATPVPQYEQKSTNAWKIPVRRISQRYYLGWKIRALGDNAWQLYNDSREAYYIEFGINWLGGNRRVRRPIRKLSLRRTMEIMMATQAWHRIWVDCYASPKYSRHRGQGFYQIVQSPGMGSFGGPMLGRRLPG